MTTCRFVLLQLVSFVFVHFAVAQTISSEQDFYTMVTNRQKSVQYTLANDLTLTGEYNGDSYSFALGGKSFDGNGHVITVKGAARNGNLSDANLKNVIFRLEEKGSLFYKISSSTVEDCTVENGGFAVSVKDSTFKRCAASCKGITKSSPYNGGTGISIFGFSATNSRFEDCVAKFDIQDDSAMECGGFAKDATDSQFIRCTADCTMSISRNAGGIARKMSGCLVEGCSVAANMIASSDYTGNMGNIGGIAASLSCTTVNVCSVTGKLSAKSDFVGGIAGTATDSVIADCISSATVTGRQNIGGLVGSLNQSTVSRCAAKGSVTGYDTVGGAFGWAQNSACDCTSASGTVTGDVSIGTGWSEYLGGFVGVASSSSFSRCEATGSVSGRYSEYLGGFAGKVKASSFNIVCSKGNVIGLNYVGGFIVDGFIDSLMSKDTVAENCYSRGSVTAIESSSTPFASAFICNIGSKDVGGYNPKVSFCYATGKVAANFDTLSYVGGLGTIAIFGGVSVVGNTISAQASYWDKTTTGMQYSGLQGAGKTSAELKAATTAAMRNMAIYATWDFDKIWERGSDGYPAFRECAECSIREETCSISISPGSLSFSADGGVGNVIVTATDKWTAHVSGDNANSLHLSAYSGGKGRSNIAVTVDANSWGERKWEVVFKVACMEAKLSVVQREKEKCELSIDKSAFSFDYPGNHASTTVHSSRSWTAKLDSSYGSGSNSAGLDFTTSGSSGDRGFSVYVAQNDEVSPRSWKILISNGCAEIPVTVSQNGVACELSVASPIVIGWKGGSVDVDMSTSRQWTAWKADGDDDPLSFSASGSKYSRKFNVSAPENQETTSKSWKIYVSNGCMTVPVDVFQEGRPCEITIQNKKHYKVRYKVSEAGLSSSAYLVKSSDDEWGIEDCPDWVRAWRIGGDIKNKLGYIRFHPSPNYSTSERTAVISVSNSCGERAELEFTQRGRRPPSGPYIWLEHDGKVCESWITNNLPFSLLLDVKSSSSWTAESKVPWIDVSDQNHKTNTLRLIVTQNPQGTRTGAVEVSNSQGAKTEFTVVQTEDELSIVPSWVHFDCAPNSTNISVRCSSVWNATVGDSSREWLAVSPASQVGDRTVTIYVTTNSTSNLRTGEVQFSCGNIKKSCTVIQEGSLPHLEIFGENKLYEGDVSTNECYLINGNSSMEKVTPVWSLEGSDKAKIDAGGVVVVNNILFTQEVAVVKATLQRDGKFYVATNIVEMSPYIGLGVWTSDVNGACQAAAENGALIVVKRSNYDTCHYCREFDAVSESPEFLMWARTNGVYLISADASKFEDADAAKTYFDLLRSTARTATERIALPTMAIALPSNPLVAVGYDVARIGRTIGGVKYDGTAITLEDGLSKYIKHECYFATFDAQGGIVSPSVTTVANGYAIGDLPVPSKDGYEFDGWWTSNNGGTLVAEDTTITGDMTFYAHWTPCMYRVRLDSQGATTVGMDVIDATYGEALPQIEVPTKIGYVFGGYFTEPNGKGIKYYYSSGKGAVKWDKLKATTLYALWAPVKCKVTLDHQGANKTGSTAVAVVYDTAMPQIVVPVKTGYTFGGYFSEPNGQGDKYYYSSGKGAKKWDKDKATTLYAHWAPNKYKVTLDGQGAAKAGTASVAAPYDAALPKIAVPTKTGYAFGGYFDEPNGKGTKYYYSSGKGAKKWDKARDTILYAYWVPMKYKVNLDGQGATKKGATSVMAIYGEYLPAITVPTKTGYTFGGYFDGKDGTGTKYYYSSGKGAVKWDKSQAVTLYARWTANKYTVKLDGQGAATKGTTAVSAVYDAAMPMIVVPTKTGYTFGGYFAKANGGGAKYYKGDGTSARNWNLAKAATLYAKWTANKYKVTLDGQGATAMGTASATSTYGLAMPKITIPKRHGYTFGGYFSGKNGSGTRYYKADGTSARAWNIAKPVTLYAKWTANKYEYRFGNLFSFHGWAGSSSAVLHLPDDKTQLDINKDDGAVKITTGANAIKYTAYSLTPETYSKFYKIGMSEANAKSGVQWKFSCKFTGNSARCAVFYVEYDGDKKIIMAGNRNYHNMGWVEASKGSYIKTFTVSPNCRALQFFFDNGTANSEVTFSDIWFAPADREIPSPVRKVRVYSETGAIGALPAVPTRVGQTGTGWYSAELGACIAKDTLLSSLGAGDKVFTAKYTPKTSTLKFSANGGKGTMTTGLKATYGQAMPGPVAIPTRVGYAFAGFFDQANGGVKYYYSSGKSAAKWDKDVTTNTTLHAHWTVCSYAVTLNGQDATTPGTTSVKATYGEAMPAIEVPSKTGYTFGGYFAEPNGKGTKYYYSSGKSAAKWDKAAATNLYAKWAANKYTVSFNRQGATVKGTDAVTATYGETLPQITVPAKTGYTFAGYFAEPNGKGTKYYYSSGKGAVKWDKTANTTLYAYWTKAKTVAKLVAKLGNKAAQDEAADEPTFEIEEGVLLALEPNGLTEIEVPDTVTIIGEAAFVGATEVRRVVLPETVEVIGEFAFFGCAALEELVLPTGELEVSDTAFLGCPGLADEDGTVVIDGIPFDCQNPIEIDRN